MKIARIVQDGGPVFAASDDASLWTPLEALGIRASCTRAVFEQLAQIREAMSHRSSRSSVERPTLLCPVVGPCDVIGVGLNYADHVTELAGEVRSSYPAVPMTFAKYGNALAGPYQDICLPASAPDAVDYEAELAVLIGEKCTNVAESEALAVIGAVAVANDVSARDAQSREGQFSRAKSFDSFCPIGPWLTTSEDLEDLQDLDIECRVNGQSRQRANTSRMIFTVPALVSFLSQDRTLSPGDVILTGTPGGVVFGNSTLEYLQAGDVVETEIEGVGLLKNCVAPAAFEAAGRRDTATTVETLEVKR